MEKLGDSPVLETLIINSQYKCIHFYIYCYKTDTQLQSISKPQRDKLFHEQQDSDVNLNDGKCPA